MNRKIFLTALLALSFSAAAFAETVTRNIKVSSFEELSVSHTFRVTVEQGNRPSVSVTVDENMLEYVSVYVRDGRLYIGLEQERLPDRVRRRFNSQLEAKVVMPRLNALYVSGASDVVLQGEFKADEFYGELSGASKVAGLKVNAREFEYTVSGASRTQVEVSARNVDFEVSGASNAKLSLDAAEVDLSVSGASTFEVQGKGKNVELEVSGASALRRGEREFMADQLKLQGSGASKIEEICGGVVRVRLSGAARAEVLVRDRLDMVSLSSASSLRWNAYGDAEVELGSVDVTGGSSFTRR